MNFKHFGRYGIGTLIGSGFLCVIALLGGLSLCTWIFLARSHREARELLEDRLIPVTQLHAVQEAYGATLPRLAGAVAAGRLPGARGAALMAQACEHASNQWRDYGTTFLVAEEKRLIPTVAERLAAITPLAQRLEALSAAHGRGDPGLAAWLAQTYLPAAEALRVPLTELIRVQEPVGRELLAAMDARRRQLTWVAGAVLLASMALAAVLAFRIAQGLDHQATALVGHLQDLAEGGLPAAACQGVHGQFRQMALDLDRLVLRLREQAAALAVLEQQASAANQAKSTFLASMSHELRTPLSSILGYARLMARDPGRSAEDVRQLGHVLRAGEHLLALINDVLSLARIEAGRLEFKPVPFDPGGLFQDLKSLFQLTAQGQGLAFELLADGFPRQLEGDLPKLRQVLVNLLGNALKFTESGHVRVHGQWAEGRASFAVEDSGPGLGLDELRRLFQPFSQTEAGRDKGGSGLGLHLSQALVRAQGGDEIQVTSKPGHGSRFSFQVPLPEPEVPASLLLAAQPMRLNPGQREPLVLVVDDRPDNREILSRLLTQAGFRVAEAGEGASGLELWRALRPDLVLMDLRMPGLDGFQALAGLRREEAGAGMPRTPVVALSASVYDVSEAALMAQGFDAYLPRPLEEGPFFSVLGRLLDLRLECAEPVPAAGPAGGLDRLEGLDAPWRKRFRDEIATGDLQAAQACLAELADPDLRELLLTHLRAYNLQELLDRLA